jgi:hypothetical protein
MIAVYTVVAIPILPAAIKMVLRSHPILPGKRVIAVGLVLSLLLGGDDAPPKGWRWAGARDRGTLFGADGGRGRRRAETILRMLRGELLDSLACEVGVTAATLATWREQFLAGAKQP